MKGFDVREYKAVSIHPVRILRIEAHEFVEQDVGNWCHAHWGSGMAGIGFECGIDLDDTDAVSLRYESINLVNGWLDGSDS